MIVLMADTNLQLDYIQHQQNMDSFNWLVEAINNLNKSTREEHEEWMKLTIHLAKCDNYSVPEDLDHKYST